MRINSALAQAAEDATQLIDERYPGYRARLVKEFAAAIEKFSHEPSAQTRQMRIGRQIEAIDQQDPRTKGY